MPQLLTVKLSGAIVLILINSFLLAGAVAAHLRRRALPPSHFRTYAFSHLVAALLVLLGLVLVGMIGLRAAPGMHIFYGLLATTGTIAQLVLRPKTAWGQKYLGSPLVHATVALLVMLTATRAIMSAW